MNVVALSYRRIFKLARACWRYRKRVGDRREEYEIEVATILDELLCRKRVGRDALELWRGVSLVLILVGSFFGILSLIVLLSASTSGWWMLLALVPLIPAVIVFWYWASWAAPIRWLDERSTRTGPISDEVLVLKLKLVTHGILATANAPARIHDELLALEEALPVAP